MSKQYENFVSFIIIILIINIIAYISLHYKHIEFKEPCWNKL